MLRYIYENAHPNARRNTVSTKGELGVFCVFLCFSQTQKHKNF